MPDRPFADPIGAVPGGLDRARTLGRFAAGGIALWGVLLGTLFWIGTGKTAFGLPVLGLVVMGLPVGLAGLLLALARRMGPVWRPAHKRSWRPLTLALGALGFLGFGMLVCAPLLGLRPAPMAEQLVSACVVFSMLHAGSALL